MRKSFVLLMLTLSFALTMFGQSTVQYSQFKTLRTNSPVRQLVDSTYALAVLFPSAYKAVLSTEVYDLFIANHTNYSVFSTGPTEVPRKNSGLKVDGRGNRMDAYKFTNMYSGQALKMTINGVVYDICKIENGASTNYPCLNGLQNTYEAPYTPGCTITITGPSSITEGATDNYHVSESFDRFYIGTTEFHNIGQDFHMGGQTVVNNAATNYTIKVVKGSCTATKTVTVTPRGVTPPTPPATVNCRTFPKPTIMGAEDRTWESLDKDNILKTSDGSTVKWITLNEEKVDKTFKMKTDFPGTYELSVLYGPNFECSLPPITIDINTNLKIKSTCNGLSIETKEKGENSFASAFAYLWVQYTKAATTKTVIDTVVVKKADENPRKGILENPYKHYFADPSGHKKGMKWEWRFRTKTVIDQAPEQLWVNFLSGKTDGLQPGRSYQAYISLEALSACEKGDQCEERRMYQLGSYEINCNTQPPAQHIPQNQGYQQPLLPQGQSCYGGSGYQYIPYQGNQSYPWAYQVMNAGVNIGWAFGLNINSNNISYQNGNPVPDPGYTPPAVIYHDGGNGGDGSIYHDGGNGGNGTTNPGTGGNNGGDGGWKK